MPFSFFSFLSTRSSLIGIDIEPYAIKLVQLKKLKKTFLVEQAGIKFLPDHIFVESKIKNWSLLSVILSEWIAELNLKESLAAIHIPAMLTTVKQLKLASDLKEAAIEAEIYAKVEEDLPDIKDTICIDYADLSSSHDYTDIVFIAARQAYVSQYVSCINTSRLNTKIVDVDMYALKRAIVFLLGGNNETFCAVLHSRAEMATLIAFNNHNIVFHYFWDFVGIESFITQLKSHLERCLETVPIEKLILCIEKKYEINESIQTVLKQFQSVEICNEFSLFSNKLAFAANIDATWFIQHLKEFLIALGLAMREVPAW